MDPVLVGTVTDGNGLKIEIWAVQDGANVSFEIKVVEGFADLRGFFLDLPGDGDAVKWVGSKDNNMNGTGVSFDYGAEIGTAGMGKDDISQTTIVVEGFTLADLDGISFGIRATSVGESEESREGSVKLVGTLEVPDPVVYDHFPAWDKDIGHFTMYFDTAAGDVGPHGMDGVYTVKIEVPESFSDDFDDSLDTVLAWLIENDPFVDADTDLLGVAIKGGKVEVYYAMDNNPDDDDSGDIPNGALVQGNDVDQTYTYAEVFMS
jgi:hypothetical protein